MSRDVAVFLHALLMQQQVQVSNPEFVQVSALTVRALAELRAVIEAPPTEVD